MLPHMPLFLFAVLVAIVFPSFSWPSPSSWCWNILPNFHCYFSGTFAVFAVILPIIDQLIVCVIHIIFFPLTKPSVLWHCWLGGRKDIRPVKKHGRWWRWALLSPDGVAPSRMVGVSASLNLHLHHKVQKFSSGTGLPGWSRKRAVKRLCCGGRLSLVICFHTHALATMLCCGRRYRWALVAASPAILSLSVSPMHTSR